MPKELRATRYLTAANDGLARFIVNDLPYMDFDSTIEFYADSEKWIDDTGRALMNANDRYYLLTVTCKRYDAFHGWLFERCREVEANPDDHLDLWARGHYKSSIGTFAGVIQEIMVDPEITIAIMSGTNKVAQPFLVQIQQEFENNEDLKRIHADVLWSEPRKEAPLWARDKGITVKRKGNPKEATVEAFGVIDGMRTGKHYDLLDFDDLIDESMVGNPEMVQKVTQRWELAGNLGRHTKKTRKWHWGTRFDEKDDVRQLIDPSSKLVLNAAIGMGRYMDRKIIMPAFFANRLAGKFEDQRVVPFPADGNGQDVPVTVGSADGNTATGMNVAKLLRLRRLAAENDIDLDVEQLNIALSAIQIEDLFGDIKYVNRDWRQQTQLDSNGKPTAYVGINILEVNQAGVLAAGVRANPAWTTLGMHVGRWQEMQTRIGENPQKQYKKQVYMWQQAGATRVDELRVFKVYNKEA